MFDCLKEIGMLYTSMMCVEENHVLRKYFICDIESLWLCRIMCNFVCVCVFVCVSNNCAVETLCLMLNDLCAE